MLGTLNAWFKFPVTESSKTVVWAALSLSTVTGMSLEPLATQPGLALHAGGQHSVHGYAQCLGLLCTVLGILPPALKCQRVLLLVSSPFSIRGGLRAGPPAVRESRGDQHTELYQAA